MSASPSKPFVGKAKNRPERDTLLLPYQIKWVRDQSRLKLAVKSRQIGWTWATAFAMVERKCVAGARLDAWISSRDEIQARLFLEDCAAFARLLDIAVKPFGALFWRRARRRRARCACQTDCEFTR